MPALLVLHAVGGEEALPRSRISTSLEGIMLRRVLASFLVSLGLSSAAPSAVAVVLPPAFATVDWSSFSYQLFSFGNPTPTLTWDYQSSTAWTSQSATVSQPDWTTPDSTAGGVAVASFTSSTLEAQFSAHPTVANINAEAQRYGTFTLSAQSHVVFSVPVSVYIDMNVPTGGAAYSWSYLTASGPDPFGGPDEQNSSTGKVVFAQGAGFSQTQSGLLYASFSNLTAGDLSGNLYASAIVNSYGGTIGPPIPEPSVSLMMLAGLLLMASVSSARRKAGRVNH
jgi:hypothetical protein